MPPGSRAAHRSRRQTLPNSLRSYRYLKLAPDSGYDASVQFKRKAIVALLAVAVPFCLALAQPRPQMAPTILKEPSNWRFERMPTPPGFAPDIKLSGFEEARFAPGMFNNSSPNYFTYVMVISADGAPVLNGAALKDFLDKYYRGLSVGVGRQRGLSPDPSQINAEVTPVPMEKGRSNAKVTFIDSFTNGRKITLNIEARVIPRPAAKKTCLILLISPQPKDNAVWQTLRETGSKIDCSQ